ncbi:MAG: D-alanyl-D-alanine carboxypeptidase family protein [Parvularculaceae bacterium]
MTRMFVFVLAALLFAVPSLAQESPVATPAKHAIIMDYATGAVLFEKDADTPTGPSSMSKLMTVAIVFERLKAGELKLTDEFFVSEKAWREREGSTMWVRVNTKIPVIDLLRGIIVQSGNDACIVIAENIAGSEDAFADLMTKKAREWGMANSTFANSSGLPDERHQMSMNDLAILARKIIHDYPEYYALFAEREFTWEKIRQPNRNPLFDTVEGSDGLKTGHTEQSGFGIVGSAVQDGERRILVVNGLGSEKERATESARLFRVAFNDFTTKTLYKPGDIVGDAQVFKGQVASVPLITKEPVTVIVHRSLLNAVNATVVYEGPITAPIADSQQIGYLRVEAAGGSPREYPLYAGRAIRETGILGKIALGAKALLARPEHHPAETAQ